MRTAVILPCYNEARTIQKVVRDFQKELPEAQIFVIDNNSKDGSAEIATKAGATVLRERKQGKGFVMRRAFSEIEADVYVMVDADDTYPASDVKKLVQPVMDGEVDMVIGTRLEHANDRTLRPLHQFGNWVFLKVIQWSFRTRVKDLLSGYRVMNRNFVKGVPLLSSGFEIETELNLQALEKGFLIKEIPIHYRARPNGSESKLRSFRDGWRILFTIFSLLRDYKPLTFFSIIAILFVLAGLGFGLRVVSDYLENGLVERTPSAILSTLLLILGMLSLLSGLIVSTVNRRFQEMHVLLDHKFKSLEKKQHRD